MDFILICSGSPWGILNKRTDKIGFHFGKSPGSQAAGLEQKHFEWVGVTVGSRQSRATTPGWIKM